MVSWFVDILAAGGTTGFVVGISISKKNQRRRRLEEEGWRRVWSKRFASSWYYWKSQSTTTAAHDQERGNCGTRFCDLERAISWNIICCQKGGRINGRSSPQGMGSILSKHHPMPSYLLGVRHITLQGCQDTMVPLAYVTPFVTLAQQLGDDASLIQVETAGHFDFVVMDRPEAKLLQKNNYRRSGTEINIKIRMCCVSLRYTQNTKQKQKTVLLLHNQKSKDCHAHSLEMHFIPLNGRNSTVLAPSHKLLL